MDIRELEALVNRVADRFEKETKFPVGGGARHHLVLPGIPHLDDVTRELEQGKVTVEFLESSVWTVLTTAAEIARKKGRDRVGEDTTLESMEEDCPYLFWC